MKHLFTALLTFSAFTNFLHAESMEEVVVTSSLLESSEINNPLYVIDGDDISDGATTSLGEAVDSYLGVSIADYGSAVGQPIIRGMSGPRVKILKNGMVNRDVSSLGVDRSLSTAFLLSQTKLFLEMYTSPLTSRYLGILYLVLARSF